MVKKNDKISTNVPIDDRFSKEIYDTFMAFGHIPSKKIELEPFKYPYISQQNARLIRAIKQKEQRKK